MRSRVFYVPAGAVRPSEVIIKTALSLKGGPDYSGITHLVPDGVAAEERTRSFHEAIKAGLNAGAYIPPEITTISRFSRKLCSLYLDKIQIPGSLVPIILSSISGKGMGLSVVTAKFISEAKAKWGALDRKST